MTYFEGNRGRQNTQEWLYVDYMGKVGVSELEAVQQLGRQGYINYNQNM